MDREDMESRVERAESRARQADHQAQGVMQSGVASIALSLSVMAELMLAEAEQKVFPNERIQQLARVAEEKPAEQESEDDSLRLHADDEEDDTDLSDTPEQEEMLDAEDSDPDEED